MAQVTPILATQVNWGAFITTAKTYTGVSPSKCLDESGIDLKDAGAIVQSMGDPLNQGRVPLVGCPALRFTSYGFLIEASYGALYTLQTESELTVRLLSADQHSCCVAYGTLQKWIVAFLGLRDYHTSGYRAAMNQCQDFLEQSKVIRGILSQRTKLHAIDGTYTLRG